MAGLDVTIVNVALPSIQHALHTSVSGLQWTIDAYTLVIACLLMLSGSLADRFGRRRVFQIGLGAFSLGSLACSLAPSLGWLIAFRGLQAIGGSMLNPVAMAIIASTFTDRAGRARAIGLWGSVAGLSLASGPVLGGPAGQRDRVAFDLLDQRSRRPDRDRAHAAVRARVTGRAAPAA